MERLQCLIYNGTYPRNFIWSNMNYILMFLISKTNYFQLWFLDKKWLAHYISTAGTLLICRYKFWWYCCKWGIAILAWRVTRNYLTISITYQLWQTRKHRFPWSPGPCLSLGSVYSSNSIWPQRKLQPAYWSIQV